MITADDINIFTAELQAEDSIKVAFKWHSGAIFCNPEDRNCIYYECSEAELEEMIDNPDITDEEIYRSGKLSVNAHNLIYDWFYEQRI